MKDKKSLWKWIGLAAAAAIVALTCRVTVIPDEVPETYVNASGEIVVVEKLTVAEQYCVDHWDNKIMPAVKERAKDAAQLIADTTADLNAAGESYGNRANETSAWSFCVSGTAKVLGLENAEKATKTTLLLDLAPFDGQADCQLHYGTVFSSKIKNAIRDGVGFLRLDDFANQVEFADLTTAFNNKVKKDILSRQTADELVGRDLSFYGCLSLTAALPENYIIVPIELEITGV